MSATISYSRTCICQNIKKKFKKFKTSPILCEGNIDEEWHGSANNGGDSVNGGGQGNNDGAKQKTQKNPRRQ